MGFWENINTSQIREVPEPKPVGSGYDTALLKKYVDRLESQAVITTVGWTLFGVLVGLAVPFVTKVELEAWLLASPIIGGIIGYAHGSAKAFMLRVEAQKLALQMQIEVNTRSASTQADTQAKGSAAIR